jgi:hypothetical protein
VHAEPRGSTRRDGAARGIVLTIVAVLAVLGLLLEGCDLRVQDPGAAGSGRPGSPVTLPSTAADAGRELAALRVVPRPREDGSYVRAAFGSSWSDVDGNGCNQRDDVLQRDAVPGTLRVARQGACDHDVIAGSWHDPYTGATLVFDDLKDLHQAMAIQIDHVVPLAEAWYSGARDWAPERRVRFANDLSELLAVDGPTNESKGDGDPAAWRPRKGYQCTYARRWIAVKRAWDLTVDASEVAALRQMLAYC